MTKIQFYWLTKPAYVIIFIMLTVTLTSMISLSPKIPTNNSKLVQELGYSSFQIIRWSLKAQESYKDHWYDDGCCEAIGFGFNHLGDSNRKKLAKSYCINGKMPYTNALILLDKTIGKIKPPSHLNEFQKLAYVLHCYNVGSIENNIGACCHAKKGCGDPRYKDAHGPRRKFEELLWFYDGNPKIRKEIIKIIDNYKKRSIRMDATHG